MNKAITTAICALMIILGLVLAIFYYSFCQSNSGDVGYFVFALLCFAESLFAAFSLYFYLRNVKNRASVLLYTLSVLFAIPVLLAAGIWLLYFLGVQFLPPPQR